MFICAIVSRKVLRGDMFFCFVRFEHNIFILAVVFRKVLRWDMCFVLVRSEQNLVICPVVFRKMPRWDMCLFWCGLNRICSCLQLWFGERLQPHGTLLRGTKLSHFECSALLL